MNLAIGDLEILIEALDAWEEKDISAGLLMASVGAMLAKDKKEAHQRVEDSMQKAQNARKQKSEIATCLKAKLILMKNELLSENPPDKGREREDG